MKKLFLIFFSCLILLTHANAETFSDALKKAFNNNPELNAERESLNISEQELKISKGSYLPTVTLSGSKSQEDTGKLTNRNGTDSTIIDVDPSNQSIIITQTLVDFGRNAELKKSKLVFISKDVNTDKGNNSDLKSLKKLINFTIKFIGKKTKLIILSQSRPGFARSIKYDHNNLYYQVETLTIF